MAPEPRFTLSLSLSLSLSISFLLFSLRESLYAVGMREKNKIKNKFEGGSKKIWHTTVYGWRYTHVIVAKKIGGSLLQNPIHAVSKERLQKKSRGYIHNTQ